MKRFVKIVNARWKNSQRLRDDRCLTGHNFEYACDLQTQIKRCFENL